MVGGYQMLDLTGATAGDPVTIDGIFDRIKNSNSKPILVKANDGQNVFAQAKEVDGDYVLTYLSAEGKTVKVVITDEDSVTTTVEDDSASIEALTEGLNELNTRVDANEYVDRVDISGYNTTTNQYTTPADGYLWIRGVANGSIDVAIKAAGQTGDGVIFTINAVGSATISEDKAMYVKKGMNIYIRSSTGEGNLAYFEPLA